MLRLLTPSPRQCNFFSNDPFLLFSFDGFKCFIRLGFFLMTSLFYRLGCGRTIVGWLSFGDGFVLGKVHGGWWKVDGRLCKWGRYRILGVWEVSIQTIPKIRCITRFNGHRRVYEKWTRHWTIGWWARIIFLECIRVVRVISTVIRMHFFRFVEGELKMYRRCGWMW